MSLMGYWGQLIIQDGVTKIIKRLVFYHDETLLVIAFVLLLVGFFIVIFVSSGFVINNFTCGYIKRNEWLESVWTFFPMFWLVLLGGPSLRILYSMEISDSEYGVRLKAIGHQWYWRYEYSYEAFRGDVPLEGGLAFKEENVGFDSYILNIDDVLEGEGQYRLLEADNRIVCPSNTNVRVLVGAEDVIHCWTVPSLGVKVDGIPGRLNRVVFNTKNVGVFYGQCSEICGANHSFIPITMEVVPIEVFNIWWLEVSGWVERWRSVLKKLCN